MFKSKEIIQQGTKVAKKKPSKILREVEQKYKDKSCEGCYFLTLHTYECEFWESQHYDYEKNKACIFYWQGDPNGECDWAYRRRLVFASHIEAIIEDNADCSLQCILNNLSVWRKERPYFLPYREFDFDDLKRLIHEFFDLNELPDLFIADLLEVELEMATF